MSSVDVTRLQRPNDRLRRRRATNRVMEVLAWLAAATAVTILGIVIWSVFVRGASQLNLDFFTKPYQAFAPPNVVVGLANAFVGTFVIVAIATLMALPVGILIAIFLNEFAPPYIRNPVSFALDVLNGIPAIVIGVFVFGLLVVGHGQSGLAGSFALAIIMLPLVTRSAMEVLALVPSSLREASLGLGVPRWRTTLGVVLPQARGGVITGAILAIARIAGETAPLLLVSSLVGAGISWDPRHPLMTVPLQIFELTESPDPADHARAWAAAFVLLMFVMALSLGARWLAARSRRKMLGRSA